MIICVCSFSDRGKEWEKILKFQIPDVMWICKSASETTTEWVKDKFSKRLPILFIGSVGIAVRFIARFVHDKFTDSPVIVMDEGGRNVIPVLSGHIGGANEIAKLIASRTGAVPVITTSTDVHDVFSIDVFAHRNAFRIINRECIKKVSQKLLAKKEIRVSIDESIDLGDEIIPESILVLNENEADSDVDVKICLNEKDALAEPETLFLVPKKYCVGVGCKKGKTFFELKSYLEQTLGPEYIKNIAAIASIDAKKNEEGIMSLAHYYNVKFNTYSAAELEAVELKEGVFAESDFVKEVVGVSNVCERAAVLCANQLGSKACEKLEITKSSENGITIAVAARHPKILTWETK